MDWPSGDLQSSADSPVVQCTQHKLYTQTSTMQCALLCATLQLPLPPLECKGGGGSEPPQ